MSDQGPTPAPRRVAFGGSWAAAVAVVVVTIVTATSVGALVAYRHAAGRGAASAARSVPSVSPFPTESPINLPGEVQLSAPSAGVVWALVDYQTLYRSTDGGTTWEERAVPGNFRRMSFVDGSDGWLLAPGSAATQCEEQLAEVWHTTDGARTWQDLGSIPSKGQCKDGVWFTDPNHGFVTASDPNHRPTVYATADGGKHWVGSTVPDNPIFVTSPGGFSLHVNWIKAFGQTLYMQASGSQDDQSWHDRDFIYTSRDGGATWTWKQKLAGDVVMVTESRWLTLIAPGQSLESVNGGQQFHVYDSDFSPDSAGTSQIVFADANTGYAEGGSLLQKTVDGGAHWARVATPWAVPEPLPSASPPVISMPSEAQLSAPTDTVVWSLVAGGYLFRSTDQGRTWQRRQWVPYQGGGGNPVISFTNDQVGYALFPGVPGTQCGQAGAQLWTTHDGAATWSLVTEVGPDLRPPGGLPFDQCKEYTYFYDPGHGFVAGHDTASPPTIIRTADGGKTWAESRLPDPPGFTTDGSGNALEVVQMKAFGNVVYAVAQDGNGAGFVFRSTDLGVSWSYLATLPQSPLRVTFPEIERWLLIGNDGTGEESTDLGATWHGWSSGYQNAAGVASTFDFATPQVGYATIRGEVYRTLDGGLNWELVKSTWP